MPTLTIKRPFRRLLEVQSGNTHPDIPMLFAWDILRLTINPNAQPTTGEMLDIYAREKPWEKIQPQTVGCETYAELKAIAAALLMTGGRSVKQAT